MSGPYAAKAIYSIRVAKKSDPALKPRRLSLAYQNAWRLALVFVAFELLVALAVVFLLMLPISRRATNDLAGLMVLSAQTWSELPPNARPAFARELARSHQLSLATHPTTGPASKVWLSPYFQYLEEELSQRIGQPVRLVSVVQQGETWHWVALPSAGGVLWVGFPHSRVGPQPVLAVLLSLFAGLILAVLAARWLARRMVAPLDQLDRAAAALGRGELPELLPESGPQELAVLARRFNGLAHQVRDLLEARTTLLAGLSHDLRTPLARMRLALEMMERRPEPAWIERLDKDIGEMDKLVGELLDLARGLGQETAAMVDIHGLLEELALQVRHSGVAIDVQSTPVSMELPGASLRRVLSNLIENARRYGGGSIELKAELTEDDLRIGVLDRGPGIPAEQLESVFRPFHRVEGSRNATTGGTGLGLAIVRQLALANGWRVHLENRTDGGLAAWIDIPRSKTPRLA